MYFTNLSMDGEYGIETDFCSRYVLIETHSDVAGTPDEYRKSILSMTKLCGDKNCTSPSSTHSGSITDILVRIVSYRTPRVSFVCDDGLATEQRCVSPKRRFFETFPFFFFFLHWSRSKVTSWASMIVRSKHETRKTQSCVVPIANEQRVACVTVTHRHK